MGQHCYYHLIVDIASFQRRPLAFVWELYKPFLGWLAATVFAYQIYTISCFYVGYPLKLLIDAVPSYTRWTEGGPIIVVLIAILLTMDVSLRLTRFFAIALEKRIRLSVSRVLIEYTLDHTVDFFARRMTGSIVNRNVTIIQSMVDIVETVFVYGLLPGLTSILLSIGIFSSLNPLLLLIFTMWLLPFLGIVLLLRKPLEMVSELHAQKSSAYVGMLSDTIANQATVRLFNGAETEFNRLAPSFSEATEAWMQEIRVWEWSQFARNTFILLLHVAVYVALISLYVGRHITLGDMAFSAGIIATVAENIKSGAMSIAQYYAKKGSLKDHLEDLLEPHGITREETDLLDLRVTAGVIDLKSVTFAYPEKPPIFHDFSLSIPSKQKIGIVGTSGAGKSSLVALLLRLYPIQQGVITVDNQEIQTVSQKSLRQSITYVPQDPNLFHRTVKENILYGNEEASEQQMVKAAKAAQAHEFIKKLPKGYDSIVGERGVMLSGGQRQRITIARAFIKNAPILIMDEATSALDSDSEAAIQDALRTLVQKKTVLVIAHRLSTLLMMDRIIVIEHGTIVEDGTHDELLARQGSYAALWKRQTGNIIKE